MHREVFLLRLSFEDFIIGEGACHPHYDWFPTIIGTCFGPNYSVYLNVYQLSLDLAG